MTKALVAYSAEGSVQQTSCPTAAVPQSLNSCWWWRTLADYLGSRLQDKTEMSIIRFHTSSCIFCREDIPASAKVCSRAGAAEKTWALSTAGSVSLHSTLLLRTLKHLSARSVRAMVSTSVGDHNTLMSLLRTPAGKCALRWRFASLVQILHRLP